MRSASGGVEAWLGFGREEFLASRAQFKDLIHPGDADIARALFSPEGESRSGSVNLRLRHADGRIRCFKCHYTRLEPRKNEREPLLKLVLRDVRQVRVPGDRSLAANFKSLIEHTRDYVCVKNRNHVILAASRALTSLTESAREPEELLGKTEYDLYPEVIADVCYRLEEQAFAEGRRTNQILQLPDKEGIRHWIDSRKYPINSPGGAVVGLLCIAPDITDFFGAAMRVRENEESLNEAQKIAGLGSFVLDIPGKRWTVSRELDAILGTGPGYDRTLDGLWPLVHADDRAVMAERLNKYFTGELSSFDSEYRIVRRTDGAVRWLHTRGRLELDTAGNPVSLRGTVQDVTDRKEAEMRLRESEESLNEAQKIAGLCSYVLDIGTGVWNGSETLNAILGIDPSHPRTAAGWAALVHPDDRDRMAGSLAEMIARRESSFSTEYRIIRPSDGALRWIKAMGRVEYDAGGKAVLLRGTIQDITESKLTEIAFRDSNRLLELFVEHAPVALAMFDREMRYLAVSRRWAEDHGIDAREVVGRSHYEVNPEVPERWKETHRRGLAGETQQVEVDRYDRADGAIEWIRWQITPWRADDGSVGGIVLFYEDITGRKRAEAQLRESKEVLQLFIDRAPAALAMFDREMRYLAVSRRWLEENSLLGQEILGRSHYEIVPDVPERWRAAHRRGLAGERLEADEDRFERADGAVRWIRWEVVPWRAGDGSVGGIILFAEDITRQKATEERLRLAASVFTHASEGILITDPNGTILEVNDAFARITGYSREEVIGQNPRVLRSGLQSREFYANMWGSLRRDGQWAGEIWNRTKDGNIYAEMLSINAIRDADGKTVQYVALFFDITEQKEHERQLEHIAHHDALTGLPNRVLLADRLRQTMAQVRRHGQYLAVVFLDLDGFKEVNDRYGHESGDRLLTAVSARMKSALREGDTLARLGGDEFVAVLLDLPDHNSAEAVLDRLLAAAAEEVWLDGWAVRVSASAGVALYPSQEGVDADLLLRQAGQAMYEAKLAGRNRFHYFDPSHDVMVRGRHENLERIRQALSAGEFVLYFQPIVNMRSNKVVGAEALIRWRHPQRGLLPPAMFLPVVEGHPLSVELGEWVIASALAQKEAWRAAGLDLAVSVNVGAFELQQANFVNRLRALLAAHPVAEPSRLEVEVLETSALEDIVQTSKVMEACHEMGVSFALDDFGSGYSSLTYLQRLPVSVLKIDQSFVRDMIEEPENLAILEAVLGLAGAFRRKVIAEGVETPEHGLMLLQLGCELAQGYGIARPMPGSELPGWAAIWRSDPRWAAAPPVNPRNRSLLFACVEHRAWLAAFEAYLQGKRQNPPSLDPRDCRFSGWLEAEMKAGRNHFPAFHAIQTLHGQLHSLAAEILAAQHGEGRTQGLERLADLHCVRDELFEQLAVFQ